MPEPRTLNRPTLLEWVLVDSCSKDLVSFPSSDAGIELVDMCVNLLSRLALRIVDPGK
jgi:hypothetical protein